MSSNISPILTPNFNLTVRSGYFEYGHALRDSRRPSDVLSDGTKPQPLDRPGSGCKLHLKWLAHQELPQGGLCACYRVCAPRSIKPSCSALACLCCCLRWNSALTLQIGMQYYIMRNYDQGMGLCNGSPVTLVGFDCNCREAERLTESGAGRGHTRESEL